MTLRDLIAAERGAFVRLLSGLDRRQWDAPTLCSGWTVRDVAAHVATDSVPIRDYLSA